MKKNQVFHNFSYYSVSHFSYVLFFNFRDNLLPDISALWTNYPQNHAQMSFMFKFFFILQLAYWVHSYPELYFQKVK